MKFICPKCKKEYRKGEVDLNKEPVERVCDSCIKVETSGRNTWMMY